MEYFLWREDHKTSIQAFFYSKTLIVSDPQTASERLLQPSSEGTEPITSDQDEHSCAGGDLCAASKVIRGRAGPFI